MLTHFLRESLFRKSLGFKRKYCISISVASRMLEHRFSKNSLSEAKKKVINKSEHETWLLAPQFPPLQYVH